jgi:hypothetical protein
MPTFSPRKRLAVSVLLGVAAWVLPETGLVDQGTARLVFLLVVIAVLLLAGPPILNLLRPGVTVTRPRVKVTPPKAWSAWRERRTVKPAGREWDHTGAEVLPAPVHPESPAEPPPSPGDVGVPPGYRVSNSTDVDFTDNLSVGGGFEFDRVERLRASGNEARSAAPPRGTEPPDDWTAAHWQGKPVIKCPWDGFRTISNDRWIAHLDNHTDPPTPALAQEVTRVPHPWAKTAVHYLGDGSAYPSGVPADPSVTLYTTKPRADELVATGLYALGPLNAQEHGLGAVGRSIVCKCGYEAPTTPDFQSHLHQHGIS